MQSNAPQSTPTANEVPVRVSVHGPNGRHYTQTAEVALTRGGRKIRLEKPKGRTLFQAAVQPGEYTLSVSAAPMHTPNRTVRIPDEGKTLSAYLGEHGWPFYRYGENIVPFEPHEEIVALCFEGEIPEFQLAERLARELPIVPINHDPEGDPRFAAAEGSIWLFKLTQPAGGGFPERISEAVRELVNVQVRVGMPVDLGRGQVKVMDNRFVIRFRHPSGINDLVERAKGRILRERFIQAPNARLVEFTGGSYREHLRIIERWFEENLLIYGEPDLIVQMTDDVFPVTAPNDPTFTSQANLTLQRADHAWRYLHSQHPDLTLGSPGVYVATIDRGVQIYHPDIAGNLTDGTPQLADCYDFSYLRPCTAPGYTPDNRHGMGVYGIIAAVTNNGNDVAGIAPNTHQLGIERPIPFTSTKYPDMLLWAAGFASGNYSAGWPGEPISPAADIISCSHGPDYLCLSGIMDDTLRYLTSNGRGGKGTLVIYSAGNGGEVITGVRTWAAHPCTMAISNSLQPDAAGVERLDTNFPFPSNFGPEIDICAQGTGSPSLNHTGGEHTLDGTSAAAPAVAAAAALMLSVDPNLTWIELRDKLRQTARKIDPYNLDPNGHWVDGFSWWYGYGRLDIEAAVREV